MNISCCIKFNLFNKTLCKKSDVIVIVVSKFDIKKGVLDNLASVFEKKVEKLGQLLYFTIPNTYAWNIL